MRHRLMIPLIFVFITFAWLGCSDDDETPTDAGTSTGDQGTSNDTGEVGDDTGLDVGLDDDTADGSGSTSPYEVALAPDSPWPKFRRDARQTGRTPFELTDDGSDMWVFETGKGIFSSPVVSGDGTVYVGSADRYFYAINGNGTEKWSFLTGEIIDSAAVLDDQGRIYFGSGDGVLYALDAATGDEVWTFQADDPSVNQAFIRWFEGNVAIGADGTLYAGNDNFFIYAIDRDTGQRVWRFRVHDQTWSLPAIDASTGNLYVGNNNVIELFDNTFAIDSEGSEIWSASSRGTIAASPVLTDDLMVLGGYNGFVDAYEIEDGTDAWSFPMRDHVYASAALTGDGQIVVPSADGTVYSIDPESGTANWAYDWGAPIRSSPAIDGAGNIYVGTGDGHLLVLNADGTRKWAVRLIDDDRDDLNASPALGEHAIYIAGESGEVFSVPFDFCLRGDESGNADCVVGSGESLPDDGVFVSYTTSFGTTLAEPPDAIDVHQALAFSFEVREGGDNVLALIDTDSLAVTVDPEVELNVSVAANRRFFTVVPTRVFEGDDDITFSIAGDYLINPNREGLAFTGGEPGGTFTAEFTFDAREGNPAAPDLVVPESPGDEASVLEMYRLAAPLPTLLPSYNQIGFDSLHYLIGLVETGSNGAVAWVVESVLDDDGNTVVNPGTVGVFPLVVQYNQGRLVANNEDGVALAVMNAEIAFNSFRVSARLDEAVSGIGASAVVQASAICGSIPLYGTFLRGLGLCNPETDELVAFGATLLRLHGTGTQDAPTGLGAVVFTAANDGVTATITGSSLKLTERAFAILLVDATEGTPITIDYSSNLAFTVDGDDIITRASVSFDRDDVPNYVRAYLMVDTYPAAVGALTIPE